MLRSIKHAFIELFLYSFSTLNQKSVIAIPTPFDLNHVN